MGERYECATCCYATTSYEKFLAHGKEHSLDDPRRRLANLRLAKVEHEALLRLLNASLGPSDVAELHAVIFADKDIFRSIRNRLIGMAVRHG